MDNHLFANEHYPVDIFVRAFAVKDFPAAEAGNLLLDGLEFDVQLVGKGFPGQRGVIYQGVDDTLGRLAEGRVFTVELSAVTGEVSPVTGYFSSSADCRRLAMRWRQVSYGSSNYFLLNRRKIIGRKEELRELNDAFKSEYSEFVAVYGRRRVGKTFLVREAFNYEFAFQHTGVAKEKMGGQLAAFRTSLIDYGYKDCPEFASWPDAFNALKVVIKSSRKKKKVIFIDEISWMDTPKSNFGAFLEQLVQRPQGRSVDYLCFRYLLDHQQGHPLPLGSSTRSSRIGEDFTTA